MADTLEDAENEARADAAENGLTRLAERLGAKAAAKRATPRDLGGLRDSCAQLPDVQPLLVGLFGLDTGFDPLDDLTAQLRADRPWGHAQVAGIIRWLGFENPTGTPAVTKNSGHVIGSGINLSGSFKTGGKDQVLGQLAYGKGIANYSNDCCTDVAPNAALNDGEAVPLLDWLVYYDHYWNDKFSSSIGYSQNVQSNTGGQLATAQHIGEYFSANLLYYPVKNVMVGGELMSGRRENKNGNSGEDARVQFTAKYNF